MNRKTETKNKAVRFLSGLFLATLLIFVVVASAETQEPVVDGTTATEVASAGAFASATGSETFASTEATISDYEASASATARAKAKNGETAIAIADAWANWIDGSTAYARAVATAVSVAGQTVWAEATVRVSVSTGQSNSYAESTVNADLGNSDGYENGDNDNSEGDSGDNDNSEGDSWDIGNNKNSGIVITPIKPRPNSIGGFIFGKGDIERYCTYKLQLSDGNLDNDARAKYYMRDVIAWGEYGLTEQEFEEKYDTTDEFCKQIIKATVNVNVKR